MNWQADLIVTALGVAVIWLYGWSLKGHFASKSVPRGSVFISAAVIAIALVMTVLLWLSDQPLWATVVGVAIELVSLLLFRAAIQASRGHGLRLVFDEEHPDSLVTEGPYRYVRHPFYVSYVVFWTGWALATWSGWALLPLAAIIAIYVFAARGEEAKFSRSRMAEAYAAYQRRTGMLFPKIGG
jgi:protein-S-isoprenylcysteine O-methyltransferase Ste14